MQARQKGGAPTPCALALSVRIGPARPSRFPYGVSGCSEDVSLCASEGYPSFVFEGYPSFVFEGYGDFAPTTQVERGIAAGYILFSTW